MARAKTTRVAEEDGDVMEPLIERTDADTDSDATGHRTTTKTRSSATPRTRSPEDDSDDE